MGRGLSGFNQNLLLPLILVAFLENGIWLNLYLWVINVLWRAISTFNFKFFYKIIIKIGPHLQSLHPGGKDRKIPPPPVSLKVNLIIMSWGQPGLYSEILPQKNEKRKINTNNVRRHFMWPTERSKHLHRPEEGWGKAISMATWESQAPRGHGKERDVDILFVNLRNKACLELECRATSS